MDPQRSAHLSSQFSILLDGLGQHGIEVPPMPGMLTVGGLHVPVTHGAMGITRGLPDYEEADREYDNAGFVVPDEQGNLYSIEAFPFHRPRHLADFPVSGAVRLGRGTENRVRFTSADEFAKIYGNVGTPSDDIRNVNAESLEQSSVMSALQGMRPGQFESHDFNDEDNTEGYHVFDPQTREVFEPAMSRADAFEAWRQHLARKKGGMQ